MPWSSASRGRWGRGSVPVPVTTTSWYVDRRFRNAWRFIAHHDSQVGVLLARPRPVVGPGGRGVVAGRAEGPREVGASDSGPVLLGMMGSGMSAGVGFTNPGPWMSAASSTVSPFPRSHAARSSRVWTCGTNAWFCSRARSWSSASAPDTSMRCASAQRRPRSSMKLGIARPANVRV